MKRIQANQFLTVVFNLLLVAVNSMSRIKHVVKLALNKVGIINLEAHASSDAFTSMPEQFINNRLNNDYSVLIVCEHTIPQCFRYRVIQKIEQLKQHSIKCNWLKWTQYVDVRNQCHFHDVIIFYRVPGYEKVLANIDYAKRIGKIVVYDTDDLIFDRQLLYSYYSKSTGQISKSELNGLLKGADLYKKAIEHCDYAFTTTTSLANGLAEYFQPEHVFILPNALDSISQSVGESSVRALDENKIMLFYGSGSKTHDADFSLIEDVLVQLFNEHETVYLTIIGYLSLPEKLKVFKQRIAQIPFVGVEEYLYLLSHANINLAPLVSGVFADCKSEIKWLEAAVYRVPTVASATNNYTSIIDNGVDGYLAEDADQWFGYLSKLITDRALANSIAIKAKEKALDKYSVETNSQLFLQHLKKMYQLHNQRIDNEKIKKGKRHLLIVNVLYPPQAMGGATVVVCNIVDEIVRQYADEYRVSVFTYDIANPFPYQVKEYEHQGISVTSVSAPASADIDSRPYDETIGELFENYLHYNKPDIVHFHCIQRLTASLLTACIKTSIPFFVTVHDAWWLSDHQFLIDKQGKLVDYLQANPMIAAQTSDNIQKTLFRSRTLMQLLGKANRVLAVSEFQKKLYQQNGVKNIVVNANGIKPLKEMQTNSADHDKVVLGYTGSVCHHKGYYFLKQIIEINNLENLQVKIIQFDLSSPQQEIWNQTRIEFVKKIDADKMNEFYSQIDVLIAPSIWPESFGLITREAASLGVWVVASDAGGLAEVIVDDVNGFKFQMSNESQLIQILNKINSDPQRFKQRVAIEKRNNQNIKRIDEQVKELITLYNCDLIKS